MLLVQAYEQHYDKLPFPQPKLNQLLQRYPTNLALNWVGSYVADQANDTNREVSLANRTTIIAPNNPQTWALLSEAIANEAQARRRSRYTYQMSLATSNAVDQLYHYQVKYSTRAVTVDPKYGHGWYDLQEAATFDSKNLEALNAYEKALSLDPDQAEVFNWAMAMFQTKWGGNRFELIHAANLMAKTFHYGVEATYAAGDLLNDGYPNAANQLSAKIIAANTALLATNPDDTQALRTMGIMLRWQNNYMGSIRYLKRLTMLEPTSGRAYDLLGLSYLKLGINQPAYDALQKAAALRPLSASIFESLAETCVHLRHFRKSLAAATTAVRLKPTMVFAVYYKGYSLQMLGQPSKALPLFLRSAQLYASQNKTPVPFWIWGETGNCRIDLGQFHRAADDLTRCLAVQPGNMQSLINRAYCYNQIGKYALSEADSRAALQQQPNNINSVLNLGDSLSYTGDKADARKEWQTALQLAPNGRLAGLARADLKRDHAPPIVSKPH
jgi:tetratricopeptide (TPR) repeat protein